MKNNIMLAYKMFHNLDLISLDREVIRANVETEKRNIYGQKEKIRWQFHLI